MWGLFRSILLTLTLFGEVKLFNHVPVLDRLYVDAFVADQRRCTSFRSGDRILNSLNNLN